METSGSTGSRHQWGPAPSGASQHSSVCRRCGLREVTTWYDAQDGAVEITTWITPAGTLVGACRVDSHQGPPPQLPQELVVAVDERPLQAAVRRCPGHPAAWSGASERMDP